MEKQKKGFPFQTHVVIGIIWIVLGIIVMSGVESLLWTLAGLLFIVIGLLAMRKKSKNN